MRITLSNKRLYDGDQVEKMLEWYEILRKDQRKLAFAAEQMIVWTLLISTS